jgi:hypothetical protein
MSRSPALLTLLLLACKSSPSSPPGNTSAGKAASPGRWTYTATLDEHGDGKTTAHKVVLAETSRTKVGGVTVIELAVELDGKPLTEETLGGFGHAPFGVMATKLRLLSTKAGVWLTFGEEAPTAEGLAEATKESPTWPAGAPRPAEPEQTPDDTDYRFGKRVKTWDSACTAYMHPAPDSGDTFSSEKCFDPKVGITRLEFTSVWGGYVLELDQAPAAFRVD